jgi:hypothetical protein
MTIQKSVSLIVCLLVLFTFGLSMVSASTLFSDGFESDDFSNWNESDNDWHVSSVDPFNGSYAALTYSSGSEDDLRVEISTVGYNNIVLSYWYKVSRSIESSDHVYVQWSNDGGSNWNILIDYTDMDSGEWTFATHALPSGAINSPNFEIQFRSDDLEGYSSDRFRLDDVLVEGDLIEEEIEYSDPVCSVDFLAYGDGDNLFNISDYYFNMVGDYMVWGSADAVSDACSLLGVSYNRTSLGVIANYRENADNQGFWETWRTDDGDDSFEEGLHQVCCIVESSPCSGNGCELLSNESCEEFCIDATAPATPTVSYTDDCSNSVDHYNDDIVFTWIDIGASDEGCADIEYTVQIYENGVLVDEFNTSDTSVNVDDALSGQTNGNNYSIVVTAYDLAGNLGSSSAMSAVVWYDNEDPEIEMWGPTGSPLWLIDDFMVYENDTDNMGLYSCEYKINVVSGNTTVDWTPITCGLGVPVSVAVPEDCYEDGENICRVSKRAEDLACNSNEPNSLLFDIDTHAPNTTKTVSSPKYAPFGSWVSWLTNGWFVTSDTEFTLDCDDGEGSGCNETYYNVTNADNGAVVVNTTIYLGSFSLPDVDGNYTITYWSNDVAGNVEVAKWEVDKLDNIAPETTKTYDLFLYGWRLIPTFDDLQVWMRYIRGGEGSTNITLMATDSEVGVDTTYYQILVPSDEDSSACEETETETVTLAEDDFNDYVANGGLPLYAEMEANNWEIQDIDYGTIDDDIYIGNSNPTDTTEYVVVKHDSNITLSFSTLGKDNIVLEYDRRTYSAYGGDRLRVLWRVGDSGDWTQLEAVKDNSWDDDVTWPLAGAEDESLVQVRFYMDDGNGDYGLIDNVQVTGETEVSSAHCEWYCHEGDNNGTWYEEVQEEMNCTPTVWSLETEWLTYEEPIQIEEECDHKICYYSTDLLGNAENVSCQVFSVDGEEPIAFVIDPQGSEKNVEYCSIPLDIEIKDMKVGVNDSTVYAVIKNESGYIFGTYDLSRDPDYDGDGAIMGGDKFYLPNNLDLDGLEAGNYTIEIYAEDLLGNGGLVQSEGIYLEDGIYARLTNGCSVGSAGGLCTLQYTACVRNASLMGFNMTKIFPKDGGNPVGDLSTLDATFYTDGGNGAVQQVNFEDGHLEYVGDIVPFLNESCEVVNGRIKFNVTLNFTQELVDVIGGGDYQFDWGADAFLDDACNVPEVVQDN